MQRDASRKAKKPCGPGPVNSSNQQRTSAPADTTTNLLDIAIGFALRFYLWLLRNLMLRNSAVLERPKACVTSEVQTYSNGLKDNFSRSAFAYQRKFLARFDSTQHSQ